MGWADKVKATAIADLAERTATAPRIAVDTPWSWNSHAVWLSRVKPSGDCAAPSFVTRPTPSPRP